MGASLPSGAGFAVGSGIGVLVSVAALAAVGFAVGAGVSVGIGVPVGGGVGVGVAVSAIGVDVAIGSGVAPVQASRAAISIGMISVAGMRVFSNGEILFFVGSDSHFTRRLPCSSRPACQQFWCPWSLLELRLCATWYGDRYDRYAMG